MRVRLATILCAVVLLAVAHLRAHDFWLASTSWTPAIGDAWTVTAQVGERFPEPQTALTADRVDLWRVLGSQGDVAVSRDFRVEKTRTSVDVKLPQPGAYLGVMTVVARTIEMTGKEFTEYLNEEGLDAVIAARRTSGDAERPAKERYARYAKIAVRTGSGSAAHMTRPVGLKAEFVPASDPTLLRPGDSLDRAAAHRRQACVGCGGHGCEQRGRRRRTGTDGQRRASGPEARPRRCVADQDRAHDQAARRVERGLGIVLGHAVAPHGSALTLR